MQGAKAAPAIQGCASCKNTLLLSLIDFVFVSFKFLSRAWDIAWQSSLPGRGPN